MAEVWTPESAKGIPTPEGRPAWDRPPTIGFDEIPVARTLPTEDGRRPLAMFLEGKYARLDEARLLRGEVCVNCTHHLPECPSAPGAYKRILQTDGFDVDARYVGFPGGALARERLALGRCPVCATEMSPEMAAAMFLGDYDQVNGSESWNAKAKWG